MTRPDPPRLPLVAVTFWCITVGILAAWFIAAVQSGRMWPW